MTPPAPPTAAVPKTSAGQASSADRASGPSLTGRLMAWALAALLVVWLSFVVMGYNTSVEEADELTDGHLASVASVLLSLRSIEFVEPGAAAPRMHMPGLKSHDYQQSMSVILWDAQGQLIGSSGGAPPPAFDTSEGFADLRLGADGKRWRSFAQWDLARERRVMVLLSLQERDDLAADIAGQLIEPSMWLLPVVALALGLAIWRGLRPLYALSDDVAQLDVGRAQRLPARHALREFNSVVLSINGLVDQQSAALVRERRLANEVAHELRTPLSSIALQARALNGPLSPDERTRAQSRIGADALRAGHVLNQLLALARTSRAELHEAAVPLDLVVLAQEVSAGFAQKAWERQDEIAVTGLATLPMLGHPLLLELALRNLLENAIKHTPPGTQIEVQLGLGGNTTGAPAWLQVCDNGARNRAEAEPALQAVDSLRLGHEIVLRVAEVHGAHFGVAPAPEPFTTCYRMDFGHAALAAAG